MFAFSPNGEFFLQVTVDNRLLLWDTASSSLKQQYAEKYHLTAQYTCVSYSTKPAGKKKKKNAEGSTLGFAAVGSNKGSIVIWDLTKDENTVLDVKHSGKVSDVVLSKDCEKLYSCSPMDKHVFEWDLKKGKVIRKFVGGKPGVHRLCLSSDGSQLLTAGPNIRLWDLKTGEKLKRFVGHTTPVTSLKFVSKDVILSASEDRYLSVWDARLQKLKGSKKVPNMKRPLIALASPCVPAQLDVYSEPNGSKFRVLVCGNKEAIHGWDLEIDFEKVNQSSTEPSFSIDNASALASSLLSATSALIARSNDINPIIEKIDLKKLFKESSRSLPSLAGEDTMMEEEEEEKEEEKEREKSEVAKKQKTALENRVKVVTDANSKLATPKLDEMSDEEEAEKEEEEEDRPLGERVEEMSKKLLAAVEEKASSGSKREPAESLKRKRDVSSSTSLSTVLEQALQANDGDLLELCLGQTNAQIVADTVKQLDSNRVRQFIGVLIKKFEDKPSRSSLLLVWVSTILKFHAEYLITVPELARSLGSLYETIQARLEVFKKLLKLSGRLDFLVSQVEIYAENNHPAKRLKA
mmetsp:Transcript_11318/g.14751  ORF Transcript_11318/g.14751 Transcript_11318/m.14751 type:complete len:578 (+) Transcript_11318:133-1866(+)